VKKKVPDKYFDAFPDKLMKRIDLLEDDLTLAPTLLALGKRDGYRVPKGYFAETEEQILGQIYNARSKRRLAISRIMKLAACGLILLSAGLWTLVSNDADPIAERPLAETLDYLEASDLDEDELYLLAEVIETGDTAADITEGISTDDIEAYLADIIEEFSDEELKDLL